MDVLTIGRVSVDLYAVEPHVGFDGQQSFRKSIGGSPTNVAVAAARLGHRVALATKVGDDGFGEYVRAKLSQWGVDTRYVGTQPGSQTPLALAALNPPETPTIAFYRGSAAPDTTLDVADIPEEVITHTPLLWVSQGSLAQGSTADSCMSWMAMRHRTQHTVLDLDYRPSLWPNRDAARAMARQAIELASVVVGNIEECDVAVGTDNPDAAADALLDAGVTMAIVKLGPDGALLATAQDRIRIAPIPITVVCGLGAGDAFGGALCHGLLSQWDLAQIGELANAAGALVATRLTCSDAMPELSELNTVLGGAI